MESARMRIEVWSDVICPFCYIGKRNYETALEQFAYKNEVELIWRCFQLDPTIKNGQPLPSAEYLTKKKNIPPAQVKQLLLNVTSMAEKAGLSFCMDKALIVNSMDAHRLSHLAAAHNKQTEVEEALFKAHFTDGKNLADRAVLSSIAEEAGINKQEALKVLSDDMFEKEVHADITEAEHFNIKGVPFFVFNRKSAVSGAQPQSLFLEALEMSFADWKKSE